MEFTENNTIKAIDDLRNEYPYAASLLAYVVIERVMKLYLLKHRNSRALTKNLLPSKCSLGVYKGKALGELGILDGQQFKKLILCKVALGDFELIFSSKSNASAIASERNKLVHSNLYIREEMDQKEAERTDENKKSLRIALDNLQDALSMFADQKLSDVDGLLTLETNCPKAPSYFSNT